MLVHGELLSFHPQVPELSRVLELPPDGYMASQEKRTFGFADKFPRYSECPNEEMEKALQD